MKQIHCSTVPTVVTIGNFDGLHQGHLKLIDKTKHLAKKYGLKSLVCGFNANTKGARLLFSKSQMKTYLQELQVDYYATLDFYKEIKNLSCEEFVSNYLCNRFQAQYVVVGENFRFGKEQSGDVNTLIALGKEFGFTVYPVKMKQIGKQILSSTYIRQLLNNGKIKQANRYLYKELSVIGAVTKGYSLGSPLLQTPTANVALPKQFVHIPFGVYYSKTIIDKTEYKSITNVGYAPTYQKATPVTETYVFDFHGNLYGKKIQICFLQFLRKERKFSSLEALKKQIEKDIDVCKLL